MDIVGKKTTTKQKPQPREVNKQLQRYMIVKCYPVMISQEVIFFKECT